MSEATTTTMSEATRDERRVVVPCARLDCGRAFVRRRAWARYCSKTCRRCEQRRRQAAKRAAA